MILSSSLGSENEMKNKNEKYLENDDDYISPSKSIQEIEYIMNGERGNDDYMVFFFVFVLLFLFVVFLFVYAVQTLHFILLLFCIFVWFLIYFIFQKLTPFFQITKICVFAGHR